MAINSILSIFELSTLNINYVFNPNKKFGCIVNIISVYSDNPINY